MEGKWLKRTASVLLGSRGVSMITGTCVAGVAAIASFVHMQHLSWGYARDDQKWLSWLNPLSVDGLVILGTIVILQQRRQLLEGKRKAPVSRLAYAAVITGVIVSMLANFFSSMPVKINNDGFFTPRQIIDMWPPISLTMSFELILYCTGLSTPKVIKKVLGKPVTKQQRTANSATAAAGPDTAASVAEPTRAVPASRDEVSAAETSALVEGPDAPSAGTAPLVPAEEEGSVTTLHLEADRPEWLTEDMAPRDAMKRYLDEVGELKGAELDKLFGAWIGTKPSLGRKALREWKDEREQQQQKMASGE